MALPRHEQIRRRRRSLVLTMALVIVAYAAALGLVVYPWDALLVHGVSLRHMLAAIAPLAFLTVFTLLFLASVFKDACAIEEAEDAARADAPEDGRAFELGTLLGRLGRALEIEGPVVAARPPEGLPPVRGEPLLAEAALAVLLADAARGPSFALSLLAEEGAVRLELAGGGEPSPAALVATSALERAGVSVARSDGGWLLTFPAAE